MAHTQILVHRWGPTTRIPALDCRQTQPEVQGAFHLSEQTSQPISILMRISLLIKTRHPHQSNPKYYMQRTFHGFSAKPLGLSLLHCQKVWSGHGPAASSDFCKAPLVLLVVQAIHLSQSVLHTLQR